MKKKPRLPSLDLLTRYLTSCASGTAFDHIADQVSWIQTDPPHTLVGVTCKLAEIRPGVTQRNAGCRHTVNRETVLKFEKLTGKTTEKPLASAPARSFYGPITSFHKLNIACQIFSDAYGYHIYLVGSSQERADYRDVDVRCMLPDEEFDRQFPGVKDNDGTGQPDAKLLALNLAISSYLSQQSDLPVDFQFQRTTEANAEFKGMRNPLGIKRWSVQK